ncbi:hypothetical protein [Kordiimonas sp.]|uniref:hypothetical protein n=1 Tax=Kordiimonas sp. TaxID=1970157 RepID=UPI003A9258AF
MTQLISYTTSSNYSHLVVEAQPEGTYIFLYKFKDSLFPEKDYLADDLKTAMEICEEDYQVPTNSWTKYDGPQLMKHRSD